MNVIFISCVSLCLARKIAVKSGLPITESSTRSEVTHMVAFLGFEVVNAPSPNALLSLKVA
jgi:hypothetical protein